MCTDSSAPDALGLACRDALRDAIARDMPMALPLRAQLEALVAVCVHITARVDQSSRCTPQWVERLAVEQGGALHVQRVREEAVQAVQAVVAYYSSSVAAAADFARDHGAEACEGWEPLLPALVVQGLRARVTSA